MIGEKCDKCVAPYQVIVANFAGGVLIFCGHHYQELQEALTAAGWADISESSLPVPMVAR